MDCSRRVRRVNSSTGTAGDSPPSRPPLIPRLCSQYRLDSSASGRPRGMIHPKRFEEIKAARNLPSPSGVAMKVLRLTESDDCNAADIANTLQADPALGGRILKYANSAYVGATKPVAALRDAVSRLGTKSIRRLALGFSLISQHAPGECRRFQHQKYWSRSLATAIAAQMIARQTRKGDTEEIFVGGLLSDVGSLALATMHPDA